MHSIRTVQIVNGSTLTIGIPADFAGRQVEVIIRPMENDERLPPEQDPRYARYIMPKPPLTHKQQQEFECNPYPLRRTGGDYIEPYEPAVPAEDWEVYRDDPA